MIRSSITISLLKEARGGPFVYWDDLEAGCGQAAALGFDAVEIFAPSARFLDRLHAGQIIQRHGLQLAAVGTGAGWLIHQLTLTHPEKRIRARARAFVREMIDWAAQFKAPAIVGSMQGRGAERGPVVTLFGDELAPLTSHAESRGVHLLYEPLNRFETNLINRLEDGVNFLESRQLKNVRLLADLFHMNIEESSLPAALRGAGSWIGHIHLADSNRRAMGFGHTRMAPIAKALMDVHYEGYVSAEVLPWPDSDGAARRTIETYRRFFGSSRHRRG